MKSFHMLFPGIAIAVVATAFAASAPIQGFPPALRPANLVLRDATIATLDPLQPEAQALAIRDGKILAVGSNGSISHYIGKQTRVLDLHGAFVTPGFIEGHGHLLDTGESLMQINVGKAANWDEVVATVKAAVAKARPG
ncbi:MAG: amidohydrolase, partial [Rhodanobacteraceae bacterium]